MKFFDNIYICEILINLSLSQEALDAISSFRKNVSENPSLYEDEENKLKNKLIDLVERNKSESRNKYLQKIYDPYKNYNFTSFPFDKKFDRDEYLLAEYLYAPCFKLQNTLLHNWRENLSNKTKDAFETNNELKDSYEKIERFSKDWFNLKQKSLFEKIDRKTLFAINYFNKENDTKEWILPSKFNKNLNDEFKSSSLKFLKSWGYSEEYANLYLRAVKETVIEYKVLTYAAIAGGTVLAAYGLGKSFYRVNNSATREFAKQSLGLSPIPIDYGVLCQPEFLTLPYGQIHANQLGFQSFIQGMNNANSLTMQSLQTAGDILSKQYNYDGGGANFGNAGSSLLEQGITATLGFALNQTENMLGSPTSISVTRIGENMATLQGLVGGTPFSKHLNQIGNTLNFM